MPSSERVGALPSSQEAALSELAARLSGAPRGPALAAALAGCSGLRQWRSDSCADLRHWQGVLATLLGAGTQSPLTQTWGAALHRTPHKRGARGRAGFGRTTRGGKRVAKGHVDKQPFALANYGMKYTPQFRKCSFVQMDH